MPSRFAGFGLIAASVSGPLSPAFVGRASVALSSRARMPPGLAAEMPPPLPRLLELLAVAALFLRPPDGRRRFRLAGAVSLARPGRFMPCCASLFEWLFDARAGGDGSRCSPPAGRAHEVVAHRCADFIWRPTMMIGVMIGDLLSGLS